MNKEWLPVWEYAKLKGKPVQTIYRWIRERKIPESNVKREEIKRERIFIKLEE